MKSLFLCILCLMLALTSHGQLGGKYTINPALPSSINNFVSIRSAVDSLLLRGNADSVFFSMADGTYSDSIRIDSAFGKKYHYFQYPVFFQSASWDSSKVIISTDKVNALRIHFASNIQFRKLTFTSSLAATAYVSNSDSIYFDNCVFQGRANIENVMVFKDFFIVPGFDLKINNCGIHNGNIGVLLAYDSVHAIYSNRVSKITDSSYGKLEIRNSTIDGVTTGVFVSGFRVGIFHNITGSIDIEGSYYDFDNNIASDINYNKIKGDLICTNHVRVKSVNNMISGDVTADASEIGMFYNTVKGQLYGSKPPADDFGYFYGMNNFIMKGINYYASMSSNVDDDLRGLYNFRFNCYGPTPVFSFKFAEGGYGASDVYTLQNETGLDSGSIQADPMFSSATDLHINTNALRHGKPVSDIPNDIDGDRRNETRTCIGADEIAVKGPEAYFIGIDGCIGKNLQFTDISLAPLMDSIVSREWDYGDKTGVTTSPSHIFNSSADFKVILRVRTKNGNSDSFSQNFFIDDDCVYPGDVNKDGIVNGLDVLYIALANEKSGPLRKLADMQSTPQPCKSWNGHFKNGINFKHADCDGDGEIHSGYAYSSNELDTLENRYTNTPTPMVFNRGSINDPPLYYKFDKSSYGPGDTARLDIFLGMPDIPFQNILGLTFSVNFSTPIVDSVNAFAYGDDNNFFIQPGVYFIHHLPFAQFDFTFANREHTGQSGFSKLASIYMPILSTISSLNNFIPIKFGNNYQVNDSGDFLPVYLTDANHLGIQAQETAFGNVSVYPNPAVSSITISLEKETNVNILLYDSRGRVVYDKPDFQGKDINLYRNNLPSGLYLLRLLDRDGSIYQTRIIWE